MRSNLSERLGLLACLGAIFMADSQLPGQAPSKGPLKGDAIEVAEVKPASPAVLKAGEKLEIRFNYSLESADQVLILVYPTTKNKYTPHPVSAFKKGQGKGVGWFAFNGPASIDEIQIKMVDTKAKKTVVIKHPVKAEWK
jgi:hypothetical protein